MLPKSPSNIYATIGTPNFMNRAILKYLNPRLKLVHAFLRLVHLALSTLSPMLMHKMAAEYRHAHVEIDQDSSVS